MLITKRFHGVARSRGLEAHVERQLRFALTRFGPRVDRVHVLLTDANGPKGGEDIICKIRIALPAQDLVVRETHRNPRAAVARAAERIAQVVSRRLERFQDWRRGRAPRSAASASARRRPSEQMPLLSGTGAAS